MDETTAPPPVGRPPCQGTLPSRGTLPDFLVIGATKAGTASLHAYLRQHPQVFVHPRREMRFFAAPHEWRRGPEWYHAQFEGAGGASAVGQVSDAYARHPVYAGVPERIAALVPEARLVYLVREPFARLEAHYRRRLSTGHEWRPPEEAFRADPSYVAASLYGLQLAEYRRRFNADRILVLRCEALLADPRPALRRLAGHLGVDHDPTLPFRAASAGPAPLRQSARRLGRAAARGPSGVLARRAPEAEYGLPEALRGEIAHLFEQDRHLLVDLAGPHVADWGSDGARTRRPVGARAGPASGLAEAPASWLGPALGLPPAARGGLAR